MKAQDDYLETNRQLWNDKLPFHLDSDFYDLATFRAGRNTLTPIELPLLGAVSGKKILHLQCHFGQDSISLSRMGADVTGIDLSDSAIKAAQQFASELGTQTRFICSDVYHLPHVLDEKFDLVFTSYGTIGWLPDVQQWAKVIAHFLKPQGKLVFAEFHPVLWMFDTKFQNIGYHYFNEEAIVEIETGTYANPEAPIVKKSVSWNHPISEVVNALLQNGLDIKQLDEFDYSPYNCFENVVETEAGKFRIAHIPFRFPMVYAIVAQKS